ncbi:hypothetical protein O181_091455 [Austropuccinia psidii MF-1]|uniref:Uncharacterized protein n=1 Tax=Austropuccinia psidii MF-1 TaxID=1389203 RepID=A0A9Q3IXT2_9BASI|nr:hypothetical protein [Austropuccinia psidii MF-1]
MASLGHFDPSQTYDGYKAVEVIDPACTECLAKASNVRRYLWSRKDGPFGKELPVSKAPTPDGTSGFSNLTGSRRRDVERWPIVGGPIPKNYYSPPDPDAEGSDELDGEEVEVFPHLVGDQSRNSSSQPLANRFHSHIAPSTPRTFQPTLAAIPTSLPPASPSPSHSRPPLNQAVRQSPITTSQHLQPMASSSRRRDGFFLYHFLPLKYFKEEIVGLFKLPENIKTRRVKTRKLWPGCSGELIEIVGR